MIHAARRVQQSLIIAAMAGITAAAQQPPQFKANVRMKDGSDGSTSTGTMYFGGAKMRAELTSDGQNVIMLVDPASHTQYMLMPSEKAYMQMPIGQGPGGMTITGPSDPTNPCAGGSGNADCVKGDKETVNGYETIRWDYTSSSGVRTRSWIATKLRFPIKTQDDDGSSTEFSNIAEGPQPASLFSIPPGFQKMDVGGLGGTPGGRGRGRGNANDPMAAAMANLSPELQAQMSAAMRGDAGAKGPASPKGSAWEKGNGWIVTVTVTASESKSPAQVTVPAEGVRTVSSSYSIKMTGSVPLNFVSPSAGAPGAPGPIWSLLAGDPTIGTPAANKLPVTLSVTTEGKSDAFWTSDCKMTGLGVFDPGSEHATMSGSAQLSAPINEPTIVLRGQGNLTLSADLKTYDLVFGLSPIKVKEETKRHGETTGCRDKLLHKTDSTRTTDVQYNGPQLDLRGQPLPPTVSTISGSKKMPMQINGREMTANVTWTIAPIR